MSAKHPRGLVALQLCNRHQSATRSPQANKLCPSLNMPQALALRSRQAQIAKGSLLSEARRPTCKTRTPARVSLCSFMEGQAPLCRAECRKECIEGGAQFWHRGGAYIGPCGSPLVQAVMEGQRLEEMKDEAEAEVFRACRAPQPWATTNDLPISLSAQLAVRLYDPLLARHMANSLGHCFNSLSRAC